MHPDNYCHQEIPVLMYHRVVAKPLQGSKYNVFVTEQNLAKQMGYFLKRGFELVTFKDLKKRYIKKPMLLTFDDGYQDNYQYLLPLLKRFKVKATIFVLADRDAVSNHWDTASGEIKANLMSDDELLSCHHSGLVEIGSHGIKHQHLTELSHEAVDIEIRQSKTVLEHLLQDTVSSFAYPYGDYGVREKNISEQAGYDFAIATVQGSVRLSDDLYAIRRIPIFPNESQFSLWKKSSGYYLRYLKFRARR